MGNQSQKTKNQIFFSWGTPILFAGELFLIGLEESKAILDHIISEIEDDQRKIETQKVKEVPLNKFIEDSRVKILFESYRWQMC